MLIAITRKVSPSIGRCELTYLERAPIDVERARLQHRRYEEALASLGVQVRSLPALPDLPDSVFVEDAAVVLDECAVIARPGADSRKPEVDSIEEVLAPCRKLYRVRPPGSVDGGDVLRVGREVFIGLTGRTNRSAIDQMAAFLRPHGYTVRAIPVGGCLHLKSAVTQVAANTLLINSEWVSKSHFPGMRFIDVDPSEPHAANALMIGDTVIYQPSYPATRKSLEGAGIRLVLVDESELGKAEGALTCCSLVFET